VESRLEVRRCPRQYFVQSGATYRRIWPWGAPTAGDALKEKKMLRKRRISQKKEQNAGRKAWPKIVANYVMYGIYGGKAGFVLFWKQRWEEPKKRMRTMGWETSISLLPWYCAVVAILCIQVFLSSLAYPH
jgi:hypothetical protein